MNYKIAKIFVTAYMEHWVSNRAMLMHTDYYEVPQKLYVKLKKHKIFEPNEYLRNVGKNLMWRYVCYGNISQGGIVNGAL